jgi:hypothetical protein
MKWLIVFLSGVGACAAVLLLLAPLKQGSQQLPIRDLQFTATNVPESHLHPAAGSAQTRVPADEARHDNRVRDSHVAELDPAQEWNALAGGMLEWQVERLTGEKLTADKKARLLAELARLREASLTLQEVPSGSTDSAALRERLTQTLALVEADRAFQKEIGMTVAEFLNEADSSEIHAVPLARPTP